MLDKTLYVDPQAAAEMIIETRLRIGRLERENRDIAQQMIAFSTVHCTNEIKMKYYTELIQELTSKLPEKDK